MGLSECNVQMLVIYILQNFDNKYMYMCLILKVINNEKVFKVMEFFNKDLYWE